MKKKAIFTLLLLAAFTTAGAQDVMKKEKDGTYIVNTTTLAKDVEGYNGTTPVEVHIKKNKIVKVVPLKSQEGPKYVAKVKKDMLPKYEGMNVKSGTVAEVDAVTGATFTSNAIKENVKRGVGYYKSHK
ncbi:MAG: FMN-binding protein [Prevotella sp.]|nr:FMN-binding protein [Prevotella sp.]MBQ9186630.1 FMN-binding protein [Prevotella sp.]